MRYLAIDLGDKRTGLAVGDDQSRIASPLEVIASGDAPQRWRRIEQVIDEQAADELVVGLPLNMDGSEGPQVAKVRQFALELGKRFALRVHLVDERLSSAAADSSMAGLGLTRKQKKSRRDALAAATILQDFFSRDTAS
jgi:putative Holliday junction resolvase